MDHLTEFMEDRGSVEEHPGSILETFGDLKIGMVPSKPYIGDIGNTDIW